MHFGEIVVILFSNHRYISEGQRIYSPILHLSDISVCCQMQCELNNPDQTEVQALRAVVYTHTHTCMTYITRHKSIFFVLVCLNGKSSGADRAVCRLTLLRATDKKPRKTLFFCSGAVWTEVFCLTLVWPEILFFNREKTYI